MPRPHAGRASCCLLRTRACAKSTRFSANVCRFPQSAGRSSRARPARVVPRHAERRTLRDRHLLGRHRRRRRPALVRHHRPPAVPSPGDPLVAARIAALEARGRSGFEEYMIPCAIVRLKQGFGRLIRSKSDRGLIVLLDGRALACGTAHDRRRAAARDAHRRTRGARGVLG